MLFGATKPQDGSSRRTRPASRIKLTPSITNTLDSGTAEEWRISALAPSVCARKQARLVVNVIDMVFRTTFSKVPFWPGFPSRDKFPKGLFGSPKCRYEHAVWFDSTHSLSFLKNGEKWSAILTQAAEPREGQFSARVGVIFRLRSR